MAQTIYASFNDIEEAERAAGALLDHGVEREDLSLVANGGNRQVQQQEVGTNVPAGAFVEGQPRYGTTLFTEPEVIDPLTSPSRPAPAVVGVYAAEETVYDDSSRTDRYSDTTAGDGVVSGDEGRAETVAKSGITTTTPEDAGVGAVKGTGVGLGVGILAGLASLVVPGVGLVIGGGALAAAIGVAALTTASGAAVGGLVGYLKDQGISETDAERFHNTVGSGGALLAVNIPSNAVDLREAEQVLNKYGATDISTY